MSFHHAPLGKGSPPGDVEPLDAAAEQSDSNQTSSAKTTENDQVNLAETHDDEARFELLSAYLDDEVTPQERKLVSQWLMDDPNTLQMYRRLLMLRQAIRTAPVQPSVKRPLEVPTPPQPTWLLLSSSTLQRTLMFAVAIALIGCLGQFGTISGQQRLQEAWQFIKSLPQNLRLEPASELVNRPINTHSPYPSQRF